MTGPVLLTDITVWFIYPETANVRLEDMNSLFGDATTMAPTPQTLAEAESLFSRGSPSSFRLANDDNQDRNIPNMDLDPPEPTIEDGKVILSKDEERGEGLGGWISNLVKKGQGNDSGSAGGSGKYKRIAGDDE